MRLVGLFPTGANMVEFTEPRKCKPEDHTASGTGFVSASGVCHCCGEQVGEYLTGAAYSAYLQRTNAAQSKRIDMSIFAQ